MEEVLQSTLKTKGLLRGSYFRALAVRIPETITLLDLPALYFQNKCSALGSAMMKSASASPLAVVRTRTECQAPSLGKLFRECLIDGPLRWDWLFWHDGGHSPGFGMVDPFRQTQWKYQGIVSIQTSRNGSGWYLQRIFSLSTARRECRA